MLTLKWKGGDKLLRDLRTAREKAVPYAMRNALNDSAFELRKEWIRGMKRTLTERNTFTARSLVVEKARVGDGRRMVARVGSTAPYMGKTEEGSIRRGSGKHKPIPTAASAGMSPGSKRTKAVRAASRLRAMQVTRVTGKSPQQRNAIALSMARKQKKRFALLERKGGGTGMFRVTLRGRPTMLWDLSRGSVRQPPHPTLEPALRRLEPRLPDLYRNALLRELRRLKVLGY